MFALVQSSSPLSIAATVTTCHRPELLRRTILSFFLMCDRGDLSLIDRWWIVNDGGRDEVHVEELPASLAGSIVHTRDKGHPHAMNLILDVTQHYDYLLHLEDDWQFITPSRYISDAITIMEGDPTIGQVLFNQAYQEHPWDEVLNDPPVTFGKIQYVPHRYIPYQSKEWYHYHRGGGVSHAHWPHFSLRPGVWRLNITSIGSFNTVMGHAAFEYDWGLRYMAEGWRTVSLVGVHCLQIGKLQHPPQDVEELYRSRGVHYTREDTNAYGD